MPHSIVWQRLDQLGHDHARLAQRDDGGWQLDGVVVMAHDEQPCELQYEVLCDPQWRTVSAHIGGSLGGQAVRIEIANDAQLGWVLNGRVQPDVDGCLDIDLSFTPATNLLPIRRLGLALGSAADVTAAWLRFPASALEKLQQRYTRTGDTTYRYESRGGSFAAQLEVNAVGMVVEYEGLWRSQAATVP
ncbi:MAG: putative glycolipid-binding domain-containing protein [Gemmatimonadaceae bacterium]